MVPNEPFLKDYICSNCHAAILQDHPEEKFAVAGYKKCNLCGYTKHIEVVVPEFRKIIYGRSK